jgi:hypothetical protein
MCSPGYAWPSLQKLSLKKKESKEDFERSLRALRKPWGKVESRELEWNNSMDAVTHAMTEALFGYKTSFTGDRSASESISMTAEAGQWRVSRYEIVEPAADVKRKKEEARASKFRTWTDANGNHKVWAKFKTAAAGNVNLEKEDGTAVVVPIDGLSEADQEYLKQRRR